MEKILTSTKDVSYEEWLAYRKVGIGGSDAGAICGLNPYRSAIDVYMDKTGQSEPKEDNEAMRQGRDFEGYVASRFTEKTGKKVRRRNVMFQHDTYSWMLANIDREVVGEDAILECKTASQFSAGKWKDGVPEHYEIQCHHYMAVTGAKKAYLACLVFGQEFIVVEIERDEEIINNLIKIEREFWEDYVLKKQLPPPDGSDSATEALRVIYADSAPDEIIELRGFEPQIERFQEVKTLLAELKLEEEKIKQEIMAEMQEAETAFCGERKFTWKKQAGRATIDSKKLKKELPETYEKYIKVGKPFRVFKAL